MRGVFKPAVEVRGSREALGRQKRFSSYGPWHDQSATSNDLTRTRRGFRCSASHLTIQEGTAAYPVTVLRVKVRASVRFMSVGLVAVSLELPRALFDLDTLSAPG